MINKVLKYKNLPNQLRIKNFDVSFLHHKITKLVLMTLCKRKFKDAEIYSEYQLVNGDFPDVLVEFPNGDIMVFEVQKEFGNAWEKSIKKRDAEVGQIMNKRFDTIVIPLKLMPENIYELETKLKEFI
jgi:hypothetical protein